MRYTTRQYAEVLYDSLNGTTGEERQAVLGRFMKLLRKNRDEKRKDAILAQYEKIHLKKHGLRKVVVESVRPLADRTIADIKQAVGSEILLKQKVNPELIAGLTILLDDTLFVNASARAKIKSIFKN